MRPKLKRLHDRCEEVGDCWLWKQATTKHGYARCGMTGYHQYAHTAAWIIVHGPVPEGHHLGNLCGHRHCIRPSHWIPRTAAEQAKALAAAGAWRGPERIAKIAAKARAKGKLNYDKAEYVRQAKGVKSAEALAAELQVGRSVIFRIWQGKAWATVAPNSSVFAMRA